jgi:spore germination protein YaaH
MRRCVICVLMVVLAALAATAAAASARAATKCARQRPTALRFTRRSGNMFGTLRWKAGPGAPRVGRYRVLRGVAVIGQTARHSMRVNVRLDHRYTLRVRLVAPSGRVTRCVARLRVSTPYRLPAAPRWLGAADASGPAVTISWQPSVPGDGSIVGYRVLRGGVVYGQTRTRSMAIPISSNGRYRFTVLAVDSHRRVSAQSAPVQVQTGHSPPPVPKELIGGALNDSTIALSWQPSQPARGRVVGYRVFRDGTPVGQYKSTSVTLANLAPSTTYTFSVVAVDGLGYLSDRSAPVTVRTVDPSPTTGHAYAFLLASTGRSFTDFQAHYEQIGTVSPTYYDCSPAAELTGGEDHLVTGWAQARRVRVLPRFNCQRSEVLDRILTDPSLRQQWLDAIVGKVDAGGDDGAVLDFEAGYAKDRDAYTSFVTDVAARLHAEGKSLVIAVSAKTADVMNHPRSTFFDYNALSAQADDLFVMCWGIHWATSVPGPQDDIAWVRQVVTYISTLPRVSKYILGMQLYAMDWPAGGGSAHAATSYEYSDASDLAARVGATPRYDVTSDALTFSYDDAVGIHHDVWYTDSTTEANRIALAKGNGFGGIGLWRLGREDQRLWGDPLLGAPWS